MRAISDSRGSFVIGIVVGILASIALGRISWLATLLVDSRANHHITVHDAPPLVRDLVALVLAAALAARLRIALAATIAYCALLAAATVFSIAYLLIAVPVRHSALQLPGLIVSLATSACLLVALCHRSVRSAYHAATK